MSFITLIITFFIYSCWYLFLNGLILRQKIRETSFTLRRISVNFKKSDKNKLQRTSA